MNPEFDSYMLAYCGLYCLQCSGKLAYEENDRKHLENIAFAWAKKKDLAEYNCECCKGRSICGHCEIFPCASEKDIDSCADCADFPCEHVTAFENDGMPHHKTAVANLRTIKKEGAAAWFAKLSPPLICHCGQRQSWYYTCPLHSSSDTIE